jgi:uncharacterized membrane protein YedE/YeeE
VDGLIGGLITLLILALVIAVVCYIVARLVAQFVPGAAAYTWIIWAIGGLVLLLYVVRLFAPNLKL